MENTEDTTGGNVIAIWSHSISGVTAVKLLVDFYDFHGTKGEVLFFYSEFSFHTRLFYLFSVYVILFVNFVFYSFIVCRLA
jgi:hypothetical protein